MDREWLISIVQKYIIILLLPFYLSIGSSSGYACMLFQAGEVPTAFSMPWTYSFFSAVIFIVVFTWPGLAYDYTLHHRERTQPDQRAFGTAFVLYLPIVLLFLSYILLLTTTPLASMAIIIVVFAWIALMFDYILHQRVSDQSDGGPFGLAFVLSLPILPFFLSSFLLWVASPLIGYSVVYDILFDTLTHGLYAVMWPLLVLVVIPYLLRRARSPDAPREHTGSTISSIFRGTLENQELIAVILGLCAFLVPMSLSMTNGSGYYGLIPDSWVLVSAIGTFQISGDLLFIAVPLFVYPLTIVALVLNILFIRDVLDYLRSRSTLKHCVATGLIAAWASVFIVPVGAIMFGIPLPFILIIGVAIVWRIEPVGSDKDLGGEEEQGTGRESPVPSM